MGAIAEARKLQKHGMNALSNYKLEKAKAAAAAAARAGTGPVPIFPPIPTGPVVIGPVGGAGGAVAPNANLDPPEEEINQNLVSLEEEGAEAEAARPAAPHALYNLMAPTRNKIIGTGTKLLAAVKRHKSLPPEHIERLKNTIRRLRNASTFKLVQGSRNAPIMQKLANNLNLERRRFTGELIGGTRRLRKKARKTRNRKAYGRKTRSRK
jgi:hypothetical protein